MGWYLVLLAVAMSLLAGTRYAFRSALNPATAFFGMWAIQFSLLALPIYNYFGDHPNGSDAAYISLVLVLAGLGFVIGALATNKRASDITPAVIPVLLGLAGVVGQLAIISDTTFTTGIPISERIFGGVIDLIRQMHFENAEDEIRGPLALVASFLAPMSYLSLVLLFVANPYFMRQGIVAKAVIASNFGLIAVNSLFSYGGRFSIVLALALLLIARYISPRWQRRPIGLKFAVGIVLAVVVGWYFSVSFMSSRGSIDPFKSLEFASRAELRPTAKGIAAGDDSIAYLLFSGSYFATPTPTLTRYLHLTDREMPGPYWGLYSFRLVSVPVSKVLTSREPQPFWAMREDVFWPLASYGAAGNSWATGIRDFILDFGRWGAPVAVFFMALFCGCVTASGRWPALSAFLILGCLWFPLMSITVVNTFFLPLVLLAGYTMVRAMLNIACVVVRAPDHGRINSTM